MAGVRFPAWECITFSFFGHNHSIFIFLTFIGTHQLQVKDQVVMEKSCEHNENPDLKQLENILKKAQKIKLSDKVFIFNLVYSNCVYFRRKKMDCQENVPMIVAKRLLKFINRER